MSPHPHNHRSSTPCHFFQVGNCQRPLCPYLHESPGLPLIQNPMMSRMGPPMEMANIDMDNGVSGSYPISSNNLQPVRKSEIQCKIELEKKAGCKKKRCPYFHSCKALFLPKGKNKIKSNLTIVSDDGPSPSGSITLPPPSPTIEKENSKSPKTAKTSFNRMKRSILVDNDFSTVVSEPVKKKSKVVEPSTSTSSSPVVLRKHLRKMRYRVTEKFTKTDCRFISHPRKLSSIDKNELVTIINYCDNCELNYDPCPYVEVKDVFNNAGFVYEDCIGEKEVPFPCPLKKSCETFLSHGEYLKHLCNEHYYERLTRLLKDSSNLYKCPEPSCRRLCSSLDSLVLHYGALPHEKVLCLLFQDSVNVDSRKSSEPEVITVGDSDNVEDIRKEKNDLEKERDDLDSQVVDLKRENKKQEILVGKLKKEIDKNEENIKTLNITILNIKKELKAVGLLLGEKKHKIADLEKVLDHIKTDKELIEKERDDLDGQVIDLRREKNEQDVLAKKTEQELQQLRRSDAERRDEVLKEVQTDSSQMLKHLNAIEKKMALKDKKIKDLQQNIDENDRVGQKNQEIKELKQDLEDKEIEFSNLKNDHEAMEKERDDLDSSVVELQKDLREKELHLIQLETRQNDRRSIEEKVKEKLAEMEETIARKDQTLKEYKEKMKEKAELVKQQTTVIKKLNSNKSELEVSKNDLSQKLFKTQALVTDKENVIQKMESNIKGLEKNLEELNSDSKVLTLENQNKLLHDELSKNQSNLQLYQEEISRKDDQIRTFKESMMDLVKSSLNI